MLSNKVSTGAATQRVAAVAPKVVQAIFGAPPPRALLLPHRATGPSRLPRHHHPQATGRTAVQRVVAQASSSSFAGAAVALPRQQAARKAGRMGRGVSRRAAVQTQAKVGR